MGITYANDTVTVSGTHVSGTVASVVFTDDSKGVKLISVTGFTPAAADEKRYGIITSGTGAGALFFFDYIYYGFMTLIFKDDVTIDATSQFSLGYNLQDIIDEDTTNTWGITSTTDNQNFLNADLEIGDDTNLTILGIIDNLKITPPDTTTIKNKTEVLSLKSNAHLLLGRYTRFPDIVAHTDMNFEYDIGFSSGGGNPAKEGFSESSSYTYDSTKSIHMFGVLFKLTPDAAGPLRDVYLNLECDTYVLDSKFSGVHSFRGLSDNIDLIRTSMLANEFFYRSYSGDKDISGVTFVGLQKVIGTSDTSGTITFNNCYFGRSLDYSFYFNSTGGSVPSGVNKLVNCDYWFGSTHNSTITYDGVFISYNGDLSGTGSLENCKVQEYKTVQYEFIDDQSTALEDVRIYIEDKNGLESLNTLSNVNGTHTAHELKLWESIGKSDNTAPKYDGYDYFPHKFKMRKYGKVFEEITASLVRQKEETKILEDNIYITQSVAATVAAYTGISIDSVTSKITLTSNHSIQEVYDYTQWWATQQTNIQYDEILSTNNGQNFVSLYDLELNNCNLTGSGVIDLSGASKSFTTIGTGSTTLTVKDSIGTHTNITFTNVPDNTEVRLYKVSDDSVFDGIEDSSGGTVTFPYTHTTNEDVYAIFHNLSYNNLKIDSITLTDAGVSIPISLVKDRNYNNPV